MKKVILFGLLLSFAGSLYSQGIVDKPSKYQVGAALYNDFWQYSGNDMKPRTINQGTDVFFLINIPVENSPLIFSLGTGIGVHNLYSNALLLQDTNNNYYFQRISELGDSVTSYGYSKNKFSVTYWDFPFEFRYRHKGGFTLALGMKFGFVLSSLTKYKGDDYTGISDHTVKVKTKDIRNMEKWRYGFTAKVGYKAMEAYVYYPLTNIFKKDQGPELSPISIGINLRPAFLESSK